VTPDGTVSDFAPSGKDGLQDVLGMKVDPERRILWACTAASGRAGPAAGSSALFRFDLASDKPPKAYWLEADGNKHLLNDLAFTASGDVYVTDSDANMLWRLPKDAERLEIFIGPGTFLYPNGIALSADEKRLYAADFKNGLSVIDAATKAARPLPYPDKVSTAGIDGLYVDGTSLIAVQNGAGRERIVRYRLNATGDSIEGSDVLESRNPFFRTPTTGVVAAGHLVYLANPNLEALDDDGNLKKGQHLEELTAIETPLH
jgi:sugar lactone lactonase YvrE